MLLILVFNFILQTALILLLVKLRNHKMNLWYYDMMYQRAFLTHLLLQAVDNNQVAPFTNAICSTTLPVL